MEEHNWTPGTLKAPARVIQRFEWLYDEDADLIYVEFTYQQLRRPNAKTGQRIQLSETRLD
jgi:hypothetical protein